ncbi:DNA-directed DNA polymerase theta [Aspergillus costaricaensis CBS 115574]|uniref:DNA-directed DNA polymerase theta n=1 Tax=Aspergillus costaricaensis CBS 115574 TaxID=1448317 RepID=A0ACD1HXH1_9EURO|nr:DNA-directed DNA polymerase theta [Aspergillus costaricaensis CBS 115574]RAK82822.1 DNA-directed DNA polymerase theta [Aspergillus costaricaensis CBS 115574]
MSAPPGQPFQTFGFQTSVDIARQRTFEVVPLAGNKRPPDPTADDDHRPVGVRHPTTVSSAVGRSVDFIRPSFILPKARLVASDIYPVAETPPACRGQQLNVFPTDQDPAHNPYLSLNHPTYGLPPGLVANFAAAGLRSIYQWQASCLLAPGLLKGDRHLVYTAPTGGGKSLVADVLMLKRIIENPGRKAILVLPYVALVQEKLKWLRRIVQDVEKITHDADDQAANEKPYHNRWNKLQRSIRVTGYYGGSRTAASWADTDIAVCTIEKANSLINSAIEECSIGDLGVVVLDELHMLDDEHRGYLLELMVTKLLLLRQKTQIIGMSATLSNTEMLAEWMNAAYFVSTYRPIPIDDYLVYENAIYPAATSRQLFQTISKLKSMSNATLMECMPPDRVIRPSTFRELANPMTNSTVALAIDTADAGHGALVFCGSRHICQIQAAVISEAMPAPAENTDELSKRLDLLADLRSLPSGLDPVLEKTLVRGVGFHHAGMTAEERELIAQAYDQGVLRILIATCSLAAGVNLPARRVIINGARMGRELVGPAMLRQMCGRAGRKGKDEAGETYLICGDSDLQAVCDLLEAEMPAIESCLAPEKRGLKRALLEAIATGLVSGHDAIKEYVRCTLLYLTVDKRVAYGIMGSALQELATEGLVQLNDDESYSSTQLGQAVVASAFAPEDGLFVYEELRRALQAFVMDGDMHIFYLFTPLQAATATPIDWLIFRDQLDSLDESGLRALQFVGVSPGFVNTMAQSGASLKENTPEQINQARIYRRAYTAFQLRDLSNEVPLSAVANRYRIPRGAVQTLAQQCHGFAAGIVKFCQRMNWGMLAAVLDHMRDRLEAGARADLLEMAQVTFVKGWTARSLRENGFRNLRALAEADAKDLVPILMMVNPRKTQKNQLHPAEAERYAKKLLAKAEVIIASANRIWEREMQIELDE